MSGPSAPHQSENERLKCIWCGESWKAKDPVKVVPQNLLIALREKSESLQELYGIVFPLISNSTEARTSPTLSCGKCLKQWDILSKYGTKTNLRKAANRLKTGKAHFVVSQSNERSCDACTIGHTEPHGIVYNVTIHLRLSSQELEQTGSIFMIKTGIKIQGLLQGDRRGDLRLCSLHANAQTNNQAHLNAVDTDYNLQDGGGASQERSLAVSSAMGSENTGAFIDEYCHISDYNDELEIDEEAKLLEELGLVLEF